MISERRYIQNALCAWVADAVKETGRKDPVIWRDGKGTRPIPPFISIEFVGSQTPGLPNYSMVKIKRKAGEDGEEVEDLEDDGVQTIRQRVRKTMTMYAFGEGAIDLLETIKASIYRQKYADALKLKGLVIPNALDVIEGPEKKENEIESSAHFDFVLTFIRVTTDDPGWIGKVHVANKLRPDEVIKINDETEEE